MSLSPDEQKELLHLMKKVSFPLPKDIFDTWCENFTVYCAEIILIKRDGTENKVFLTYRDDKFFKGWHIPGSVVLPGEKINDALKRVTAKEIRAEVSEPKFFDWFERLKGSGVGESSRGQEMVLVFLADYVTEVTETDTEKFFSLSGIPKNFLSEQVVVLEKFRKKMPLV